MSAPSASDRFFERLPHRLRPRAVELPGKGYLRMVELIVLVIVGLVLAVATVNDVGRGVNIGKRLKIDMNTWRTYTHHDYKNIGVDQTLLGTGTSKEVVCGNDAPGPPKERVQICLMVEGPTSSAGLRPVTGGWYLGAHVQEDNFEYRYACFGRATKQGLCPR